MLWKKMRSGAGGGPSASLYKGVRFTPPRLRHGNRRLRRLLVSAALVARTRLTVLVFGQGGVCASRERRGGFGRVVSSLVIVGLLTLAFGVGSGHKFSTFGLIPATLLVSAVAIGLFRASYDVVTRDILRV